jgi:3-oxoacyl-[acyl-carrier protein] reductase
MKTMTHFAGKTAIVTGAGVGIGYEIARRFAQAGANVALNDLDADLAMRAATRINSEGGVTRVVGYGGDVADVGVIRGLVADVDKNTDRVDVVVANAGITNYGEFLDYTPEAFDRLMAVNLRGSYFTAQAAARAMIGKKIAGRIILMSSVTGVQAYRNLGAYGITKAGIRMMARALAVELGEYGITVNALCPGATLTERTLADDPRYAENWAGVVPVRRPNSVMDIAEAALFLASPGAGAITGQTLVIDGGWSLQSKIPDDAPDKPEISSQLR